MLLESLIIAGSVTMASPAPAPAYTGALVARAGGMLPFGSVNTHAAFNDFIEWGTPISLGFDIPLKSTAWLELGVEKGLVHGNAGCPPILECNPSWLSFHALVKTKPVMVRKHALRPALGLAWGALTRSFSGDGELDRLSGPHLLTGIDYLFVFSHVRIGPSVRVGVGSFEETGFGGVHGWLSGGVVTEICAKCTF